MRALTRVALFAVVAAVFCTPLFLGLGGRDQENDEAIYSYAVESIVETGDWLNPRLSPTTDSVFLEKPPLKFWIVALPVRLGLLRDDDFGLRFWDACFGSLALLYVFAIGRRMAGWFCGVAALLILYSFESLLFAHGLRGNNMEAPLVLAYAGGVYHFLRWSESDAEGASWRHALAVGAYFLLGFMTKFVAALFLPAILGAAALELQPVRDKALAEWRRWGVVAAAVVAAAAPWFLYQMQFPDRGLWQIMLGAHVYQRFSGWLDPHHLKPWYYYFADLIGQARVAGTLWIVVAGFVLVHARVLRERWIEGTAVLYWFWLPFVLISFGSSKLRHYAYPFLPPVALAGGYVLATAADAVNGAVAGRPPSWMSRTARVGLGWAGRWDRLLRGRTGRVLRGVLTALAAACLAVAAINLVYPGRLGTGRVFAIPYRPVWRRTLVAVALGALAGRGRLAARVAVLLVLTSLLPIAFYRSALTRTSDRSHPLRAARDCVHAVQMTERRAGRPVQPAYIGVPDGLYQHSYFFYFRKLGWDRHDGIEGGQLMQMLGAPELQRPILMPAGPFSAVDPTRLPRGTRLSSVRLDGAVLALPGPYAACGQ